MHDVVIAGAGPVGLFLACELRLAGVAALVLEQAEDPHSPLKRLPFGLRGLSAPTLEALHRRGLLDEVAALQVSKEAGRTPAAAHWANQPRRPGGHFAGIPFYQDDVDASKWRYRLPTPAGTSMAVEMASLRWNQNTLTKASMANFVVMCLPKADKAKKKGSEGAEH